MRICSLLPSATEIAFALGLGDQIVGVTHECDYPPEAKNKTVMVSSLIHPEKHTSAEIDDKVAASLRKGKGLYTLDRTLLRQADPDLILTQELCDVCALDYGEVVRVAEALPRKPKVIPLNPRLLSDVFADIKRIGEATRRKTEADKVVRQLTERLNHVRERVGSPQSRPRVACLEWLDPFYSAGHWVPEMVELAGGRDGLAAAGEPSAKISWQILAEFAPEVIILMPCGFDVKRTLGELRALAKPPGWDELPAVRQRRVFAVNGHAYFSRPGPRLIDGLEFLAQILHPKIFPWRASPDDAVEAEWTG